MDIKDFISKFAEMLEIEDVDSLTPETKEQYSHEYGYDDDFAEPLTG